MEEKKGKEGGGGERIKKEVGGGKGRVGKFLAAKGHFEFSVSFRDERRKARRRMKQRKMTMTNDGP